MLYKEEKLSSGNVHDLCHAAPYIRMSSNPTGGFLKMFSHIHFLGMYIFMCFSLYFANCLFVLIFCVFFLLLYCIVFFNKSMKYQGASCPSLAVGVLSQSRCSCCLRVSSTTYEPPCEKTGLRGFRPGPTQTGLYSYRGWLEA